MDELDGNILRALRESGPTRVGVLSERLGLAPGRMYRKLHRRLYALESAGLVVRQPGATWAAKPEGTE